MVAFAVTLAGAALSALAIVAILSSASARPETSRPSIKLELSIILFMMFSRFNFFEWFMKTGYPVDKYRLSVASHMNEPRLLLVPLALARKHYLEITLNIFDK